jgi:hypothetical protein
VEKENNTENLPKNPRELPPFFTLPAPIPATLAGITYWALKIYPPRT